MIADDKRVALEGFENVILYQEAFNSDVVYYSSTRPSVGRANGDFAFTLLRYDQPQNDQAGALSFVVDLEPPDSVVKSLLQSLQRKNPRVVLKPVPWTSGVVTAAIRGGDPVSAIPSLIGRNSVVINIGLTTNQYLILTESMKQATPAPISVVYKLTFDAYREAYQSSIKFNQVKFREWVQKKCSLNLLFIEFEKVETFEELTSSDVVEIVTVNKTESEPDPALKLAFLKSLKAALKPLPQFETPAESSSGAWLIGFSCSEVQDIQNLERRLDVKMEVNDAVTRSVYIQGAVSNLAQAYQSRPVVKLPRSGEFTQDLVFRCRSGLDGHPVNYVRVIVKGKYPQDHIFQPEKSGEWRLSIAYDGVGDNYSYSSELNFDDKTKIQTKSIQISRKQNFIDIIPAEYFDYRPIDARTSPDFPWKLFRSIKVTLRALPQGSEQAPAHLTDSCPVAEIEYFSKTATGLEFCAVYRLKNNETYRLTGLPSANTIFLNNPLLRRTFRVRIDATFGWADYDRLEIFFKKPLKGLSDHTQPRKVLMTKEGARPSWTYWQMDDDNERPQYRFKWMLAGEKETRGTKWISATSDVLTVTQSQMSEAGTTITKERI
jgi:hypothetical protein